MINENYDHIVDGVIKYTGQLTSNYYRNLTGWGNPECIPYNKLQQFGILKRETAALSGDYKHGDAIIEENRTYVPAVPKTVEDIKNETFVPQITPRQCRIWLSRNGLLSDVENAIKAVGGETLIEWEYAVTVDRDNILIGSLAAQLNMTDDDIHRMFYEASKI